MSGFNIFQQPPLIMTLWWYVKNIGVYRAKQQGYGDPLTIIMSKKLRKEEKPHGKNPPSRKDIRGKQKKWSTIVDATTN